MTKIFLAILGLIIIFWFFWRYSSRRYTLPCPTWLGWLVEQDNPFCKINRAATIIEHLDLKRGMKVLDVGCGPGRLSIPIAQKIGPKGEVVAMDIQEGMLDRTREKAKTSGLTNINYVHGGIGAKKLKARDFDRALLVTVLGEIPDQAAALKEIYECLKPGGFLFVTEIIFDPHYQRRGKVLQLAQLAGFREKDWFGNSLAYTVNLGKP